MFQCAFYFRDHVKCVLCVERQVLTKRVKWVFQIWTKSLLSCLCVFPISTKSRLSCLFSKGSLCCLNFCQCWISLCNDMSSLFLCVQLFKFLIVHGFSLSVERLILFWIQICRSQLSPCDYYSLLLN